MPFVAANIHTPRVLSTVSRTPLTHRFMTHLSHPTSFKAGKSTRTSQVSSTRDKSRLDEPGTTSFVPCDPSQGPGPRSSVTMRCICLRRRAIVPPFIIPLNRTPIHRNSVGRGTAAPSAAGRDSLRQRREILGTICTGTDGNTVIVTVKNEDPSICILIASNGFPIIHF